MVNATARFGRSFVWGVALLGTALLGYSLYTLAVTPVNSRWLVAAGLVWISSTFAIRIPSTPATIHVSEAFVFTLAILFGPAPATVAVAIDGLLISLRRRNHELHRIAFNMGEPAISTWTAATLFFLAARVAPLGEAPSPLSRVLLPTLLMAGVYSLLNTSLTAVPIAWENKESPFAVWRRHFAWLLLNGFSGASVALVLALMAPTLDIRILGVVLPVIVVFYLTFKTTMARAEDAHQHLSELNRLLLSTVETLAMAIDAKDQITHGHIRRVQVLSVALSRALGVKDAKQLKALETAALLHDIGKLGVPEYILNKPARLTDAEYEAIKLHAAIGAQLLSAIQFPYPVVPVVRHHHERWDGTGYPDGLKGIDIPLGARIMSVVDCYDALTSDRPYRRAMSPHEALAVMEARRGTMYDPLVLDAFIRVQGQIALPPPVEEPHLIPILAQCPASLPSGQASIEASGQTSLEPALLELLDVAVDVGHPARAADVADAVGRRLRQLLPADSVVFYLRSPDSNDVVATYASGHGAEAVLGLRLACGEGLSGWVAANRTTIVNSSPALDLADRVRLPPPKLESAMATSLVSGERVIGALALYAAGPEAFTDQHRQVVELAVPHVARALQRAMHTDAVRASRLFDAATGLPNEAYLDRALAVLLPARERVPRSVGAICIRLENAPRDGTALEGALERIATAVRQSVRVTDMLFRTGLSELVVLMADADRSLVERVGGRLTRGFTEAAGPEGACRFAIAEAHSQDAGGSAGEIVATARSRLPSASATVLKPVRRSA